MTATDTTAPSPATSAGLVPVGSLFSGYGGLDMAVCAAVGGRVVWHVEYDDNPAAILEHNHPEVPNYGDVTTVDWTAVTPVKVLTGGFPCQDLSHAGRRAGIVPGSRSGLWEHMAYAIKVLRPELVVVENVRGLLSARGDATPDTLTYAEHTAHAATALVEWIENRRLLAAKRGDTDRARELAARKLRTIRLRDKAVARARRLERGIVRAIGRVLGDLDDLGYDAEWRGLRAADVGAPHGRFRVFITAWPRDAAPDPQPLPRREH